LFNHNVKVLGYFLSEEERALKRQWSQENYQRMVTFKRLRRNKIILQKTRMKRMVSYRNYEAEKTPETDNCEQMCINLREKPTVVEQPCQYHSECDRMSEALYSMVRDFSRMALLKIQEIESTKQKVQSDDAFVCLKNLLIPEFPLQ